MNKKNITFIELLSWIKEKFKVDGYDVFERFEKEPLLPVDLICKKKDEDVVIIIAPVKEFSENLEKRLSFFQSYFSHFFQSRRLKIFLAVPGYFKISSLDSKKIEEKEYGFGLLIAKDKNNIAEYEKLRGFTFREKMTKDLENAVEKKDVNPKKYEDLSKFFDKYIHFAIDGIVGEYPIIFEKQYIDRKLLEKSLSLEKVPYKDKLHQLVNDHLIFKENDYKFSLDSMKFLWKEYAFGIDYSKLLKAIEPFLREIFLKEKYRDHFLHQFQVFLLGTCILDRFYDRISNKYGNDNDAGIIWLITSTFHDFAYPVQLYDSWTFKFFNEVFRIEKNPGAMELKSHFVEQTFLGSLINILSQFKEYHFDEKLSSNWLANEGELLKFFHRKVTEEKNHAVLSAISLLKFANTHHITPDRLHKIFVPSALSIALHHDTALEKVRKGKKVETKQSILPYLKFDNDPISFILIFCDTIQESGRPIGKEFTGDKGQRPQIKKEDTLSKVILDESPFEFIDLKCEESNVEIIMKTPHYPKTHDLFRNKENEFKSIEGFLKQPTDIKFRITLIDKNDIPVHFEMLGPPD